MGDLRAGAATQLYLESTFCRLYLYLTSLYENHPLFLGDQ